jgi:hypothetical protein
MPTSRRNAIKSIAATAVTAPLVAQHVHSGASELVQIATKPAPYAPKFFSPAQFETVRLLADLIIPRTDTPGAADAGVHVLIDKDLAGKPAVQKAWTEALAWFDSEARKIADKPFAAATQQQQIRILTAASSSDAAPGWAFFTLAKGATVDAYYNTKIGLQAELGWNANTYLPEFHGCTHEEHQG